jgi:hypothetical protein
MDGCHLKMGDLTLKMGVSIVMEDPQYMDGLYIIYNRKTYEKVDDLGVPPIFGKLHEKHDD